MKYVLELDKIVKANKNGDLCKILLLHKFGPDVVKANKNGDSVQDMHILYLGHIVLQNRNVYL